MENRKDLPKIYDFDLNGERDIIIVNDEGKDVFCVILGREYLRKESKQNLEKHLAKKNPPEKNKENSEAKKNEPSEPVMEPNSNVKKEMSPQENWDETFGNFTFPPRTAEEQSKYHLSRKDTYIQGVELTNDSNLNVNEVVLKNIDPKKSPYRGITYEAINNAVIQALGGFVGEALSSKSASAFTYQESSDSKVPPRITNEDENTPYILQCIKAQTHLFQTEKGEIYFVRREQDYQIQKNCEKVSECQLYNETVYKLKPILDDATKLEAEFQYCMVQKDNLLQNQKEFLPKKQKGFLQRLVEGDWTFDWNEEVKKLINTGLDTAPMHGTSAAQTTVDPRYTFAGAFEKSLNDLNSVYLNSYRSEKNSYLKNQIEQCIQITKEFQNQLGDFKYQLIPSLKTKQMKIYTNVLDALTETAKDPSAQAKNSKAIAEALSLLNGQMVKNNSTQKLIDILNGVDERVNKNPDFTDPQEKSRKFLLEARRYLLERKWETFSLTKSMPDRVVAQLREIDKALEDGNYVDHQKAFLKIGRKDNSRFTRKSTSEYFMKFKNLTEENLVQNLSEEFKPKK